MLLRLLCGIALLTYAQLPSLVELEEAGLHLSTRQRMKIDSLLKNYRRKLFCDSYSQERFYWVADSLSEAFLADLRHILTPEQWRHYQRAWGHSRRITLPTGR